MIHVVAASPVKYTLACTM
jgi:hypothetical protein